MPKNNQLTSKQSVLMLSALLTALAVTMPEMCMPVLFKEISEELRLNLVQIGTVWGIVPLGSVVFLFVGGVLCDRFGVKRAMGVACLLAGAAGAMRGLSGGFTSLVAFSFLFGIVASIIPVGVMKACRIWFTSRQLGFATGVIVTGGGIGAAIGSMVSATVLSPLLGGWRNVMFLYGAISVALGIIWLLTIKETKDARTTEYKNAVPARQAILHVLPIKAVWLIGFNLCAYVGSMKAIMGYIPLYLREIGWSAVSADGALTAFTLMTIIGAIPLTLLSDKLGRRKVVLFPAILIAIICSALLPIISGVFLWGVFVMLGVFHQVYIALTNTMVLEIEEVGVARAGMALGLALTLQRIGAFIASPIGNSLAVIDLGMPFVFWSILFVCGALILMFVKETGWKVRRDNKKVL
ncbi:MAG TPA: MFS transporter [Dehalococcoidia bacterium]|nr:MFS transporter [Dehalococcoidia bacterium]